MIYAYLRNLKVSKNMDLKNKGSLVHAAKMEVIFDQLKLKAKLKFGLIIATLILSNLSYDIVIHNNFKPTHFVDILKTINCIFAGILLVTNWNFHGLEHLLA